MAGTREGGLKAATKNLAQDPDFYKRIGRKGGKSGTTGGFASNRGLASIAGRKGGLASKRPKNAPFKVGDRVQVDPESRGFVSRSSRGKTGTVTEYNRGFTFPVEVKFDDAREGDEVFREKDLVRL